MPLPAPHHALSPQHTIHHIRGVYKTRKEQPTTASDAKASSKKSPSLGQTRTYSPGKSHPKDNQFNPPKSSFAPTPLTRPHERHFHPHKQKRKRKKKSQASSTPRFFLNPHPSVTNIECLIRLPWLPPPQRAIPPPPVPTVPTRRTPRPLPKSIPIRPTTPTPTPIPIPAAREAAIVGPGPVPIILGDR